jgi:hypothetical protein
MNRRLALDVQHRPQDDIHALQEIVMVSVNVFNLLAHFCDRVKPLSVITTDHAFRYQLPRFDQTGTPLTECAIEFILKKL